MAANTTTTVARYYGRRLQHKQQNTTVLANTIYNHSTVSGDMDTIAFSSIGSNDDKK